MKNGNGFIQLNRSKEAEELLLKRPNAFLLLTQIAMRARRTDAFNAHGLEIGEALIGDYKSCGLTERTYRTAKKRLAEYGFATFKPTNKGTIAKLSNKSIYDINAEAGDEQSDGQTTDKRRASDD